MRFDPRTKRYVERRRAEGKTNKEIIRCLKRYIAREIYRSLTRPSAVGPSEIQSHVIVAA
jgi:hypothetical protein